MQAPGAQMPFVRPSLDRPSHAQPSIDRPAWDEAARLAVIADTQTAIHSKRLSLQESLQLVIERASCITHGTGAAIWLLQGKNAVCQVAFGTYKASVGQNIAIDGNRLARCFQEGQILRCEDALSDPRVRYDALPGRAEGSLLAVPIHHEGRVEGTLEVTFAEAHGFGETDLRTCQILSGLVSEAVALSAEQEWKHVLHSERATLLEALDRIQPHLSKLLSGADEKAEGIQNLPAEPAEVSSPPVAHSYGMANLGKFLLAQQEQEKDAGMPSSLHPEAGSESARNSERKGSTPIPREVQTALNLSVVPKRRGTQEKPFGGDIDPVYIDSANRDSLENDSIEMDSAEIDLSDHPISASHPNGLEPEEFGGQAFSELDQEAEPGSATLALRDLPWLDAEPEALILEESPATPALRFWKLHWADICLAASAVMLAATLVWALWPPSSNTRDGSLTSTAQQPKLTVFEELLVAVGLAEAPPPVANLGAPGTRVWVDLHSALYYCPGAEPYGKTPKGKFLTQHDAQYQQFQPARGQPCD